MSYLRQFCDGTFCPEIVLEGDALHVFQVLHELVEGDVACLVLPNLHSDAVVGYRAIDDVVVMGWGGGLVVAVEEDEVCPFAGVAFEGEDFQFA